MQTRRSFLRTSLAATTAVLADVSSIVAKERPAVSNSPSEAYVGGVKFLTPDAPDYAAAREVYNAGILTQPKIIAFCVSETGVQHAVERAKAENWPVAVKAGGHSFEGFCLNDDGLVVSVSPMREMQLDPKTGILTAGAGCRLEEVNKFLLAKGRFPARWILQNSRSGRPYTWRRVWDVRQKMGFDLRPSAQSQNGRRRRDNP